MLHSCPMGKTVDTVFLLENTILQLSGGKLGLGVW